MKLLIWIVSLAAIAVSLALAASGPGTQLGLWDYGTGLGLIRKLAIPVTFAACASIVVLLMSLVKMRALAPLALAAALISGFAAYTPLRMKQLFEGNPVIHDITTDFADPPPIIAAADLERSNPPEYLGQEVAPRGEITVSEAQKKAFPDIEALEAALTVEDTAALSRKIIRKMGMKILSDQQTEDGWLIEAADKSMWFGFVDDFIVRITQEENKVIIDLRSKSRVGGSDLGANARRVQKFMELAQKGG